MKRYAMIGVAGYVAPRHLRAISETGGELVAAVDPSDSVGVIDGYFPGSDFFVEFERFDRHLDLLRRRGEPVDTVVVCSPNYLHDAHCRFALRSGCDVICEKPVVINPWNLDGLDELEAESGCHLNAILQLRLHPAIQAVRQEAVSRPPGERAQVELRYVTARGRWYLRSWKGSEEKSGGLAVNIGIHFFDVLQWIYGRATDSRVMLRTPTRMSGELALERADVRWLLSIDENDLPADALARGQRTFRSFEVDEREVDFTVGFEDLHTASYRRILEGEGFGLVDARPSIELVYDIRHEEIGGGSGRPAVRREEGA